MPHIAAIGMRKCECTHQEFHYAAQTVRLVSERHQYNIGDLSKIYFSRYQRIHNNSSMLDVVCVSLLVPARIFIPSCHDLHVNLLFPLRLSTYSPHELDAHLHLHPLSFQSFTTIHISSLLTNSARKDHSKRQKKKQDTTLTETIFSLCVSLHPSLYLSLSLSSLVSPRLPLSWIDFSFFPPNPIFINVVHAVICVFLVPFPLGTFSLFQ